MSDPIVTARRGLLAGLWAFVTLGLPMAAAAAPQQVTVFAASSMTDALNAAGAQYTAETGIPVRFSFGASSAIARQIESGAPADVFVSADTQWMDYLQAKALVRPATRRDLVGNRLVLIAPADSKITLKIAQGFPLAKALGEAGRLSTGDPDSVPVGRYARSALTQLRVWSQVEGRLVRAENVRSALVFVARGEAPLGIVYQTDALAEPKVKVIGIFPTRSHSPIVYPGAVTASGGPAAAAFLNYLAGPKGQAIFKRFGFTAP